MQASSTNSPPSPFHPNQITASNSIIDEFQDKYYVQLQAQTHPVKLDVVSIQHSKCFKIKPSKTVSSSPE